MGGDTVYPGTSSPVNKPPLQLLDDPAGRGGQRALPLQTSPVLPWRPDPALQVAARILPGPAGLELVRAEEAADLLSVNFVANSAFCTHSRLFGRRK